MVGYRVVSAQPSSRDLGVKPSPCSDEIPNSRKGEAARLRLGGRAIAVGGPRPQLVTGTGQALAGREIELPAVQLAGHRCAVDEAEPGEVRLQMRASSLHDPIAQAYVLGIRLLFGVPALGVLQALLGQALEERVDEFVVLTDARGREAAAQEQRVAPSPLVDRKKVLDVRGAG